MTKKYMENNKNAIRILGVETSCDETAAAIVVGDGKNPPHILSNVVASQVKIHARTGGIVPEVAARAHAEKAIPVIEKALSYNNCHSRESGNPDIKKPGFRVGARNDKKKNGNDKIMNEIDAIAVTTGPGLIGSLLIGIETARALSYVFNKPIIPINHLEGHIYSNFVRVKSEARNSKFETIGFPALCLIVSGGHSSLILMKDHGKYREIGSTRDDAAGEAFDKVAKLLGLPYPGGPSIAKAAEATLANSKFDSPNRRAKQSVGRRINSKFQIPKLPRPMIDSGDFDFSFSGLKTAVLYLLSSICHSVKPEGLIRNPGLYLDSCFRRNDKIKKSIQAAVAAEFQQAVVDVLAAKTLKAAQKYKVKTVILGGGVAANQLLRQTLEAETKKHLPLVACRLPLVALSTDNAAMIAAAGYYHYIRKDTKDWKSVRLETN